MQARLVETDIGEKYLVSPESVAKHIAYIHEVMAATGRDKSRRVATGRDSDTEAKQGPTTAATGTDAPRQVATSPDLSPYVARVESENEFLRTQIGVKDTQIKELTERAREMNHLVAGLQKMLSPLLSAPRDRASDGPDQFVGG